MLYEWLRGPDRLLQSGAVWVKPAGVGSRNWKPVESGKLSCQASREFFFRDLHETATSSLLNALIPLLSLHLNPNIARHVSELIRPGPAGLHCHWVLRVSRGLGWQLLLGVARI